MPYKPLPTDNVPGHEAVELRLQSIDANVALAEAFYDFDTRNYRLTLVGPNGRHADAVFNGDFLDDVRDNPDGPRSKYSIELTQNLHAPLLEAIETKGLIAYGDELLKYFLLQFIYAEQRSNRSVEKYNTIGKGIQGDFERWLRADLTTEEKDKLIWAWSELLRLRLIAPTGTDLAIPDNWVKVTEKGISAVEGKSYADYAEIEIFIGKGEVYTGMRQVQLVFQQAKGNIVIIDPWVDESMLDFIAALDPVVSVQLATQNVSKSFGAAYAKLAQQRGNVEARSSNAFHDRFVILDGAALYHFGSSLNHLGKKATVVSKKSDDMLARTLGEFNKYWPNAQPL
ncbi:hypothetical protein [Acidipila rosea]|uniref:Uncharacterized protein n=1 Tax=Acidipila rosea TaxID=768535 RepID=A0A4R1KTI5_9BACT|nr:hypothetical protein [Acidipila rosea]TCK68486.1 hypothetical protein C7378_3565 [Acidipila rosea]